MRKLALSILFAGGFLASAPALADTFVTCPFSEVISTITEPGVPGWRAVPGRVPLSDTRIEKRRGADVLQCIYGAAGVLEVQAPPREQCTARSGGFLCETRRPPGPRVVASGTIRVPAAAPVDLDTGQITGGGQADFWIRARNPFERYLAPLNGARFALADSNDPGPRDCRRLRLSADQVPMAELIGANWLCFVTDDGRAGRLRVTNMTLFPMTLDVAFTTWE